MRLYLSRFFSEACYLIVDIPYPFHSVFIDAPHILLPVDLGVAQPISPDTSSALTTDSTSTTQDALRAFGANEAADAPDDLSLQPRGWWKVDRARTRAYGIEETLVFLRDVLREKRFVVSAPVPPFPQIGGNSADLSSCGGGGIKGVFGFR